MHLFAHHPPNTSQTIELIKYNIPCFVEKPLGSSLKGVKELERLLKKVIPMMGSN